MKRILVILAAAAIAAVSCKPGPVVISGTVTNLQESLEILRIDKGFQEVAIPVGEDGSFRLEIQLDEPEEFMLAAQGQSTDRLLAVPGTEYKYQVDLTNRPGVWNRVGGEQADQDCRVFYDKELSAIAKKPFDEDYGPFKDYSAFLDSAKAVALQRVSTAATKSVRKYYGKKLDSYFLSSKLGGYYNNMVRFGRKVDSDPDYNAFVNGIDLSAKDIQPFVINQIINYKMAVYGDDIPQSERNVRAIEEVAKDKATRDSMMRKFLDIAVTDGQFSSREEGDFLIETSGRYFDEAAVQSYRETVDKVLSLTKGADWIDFEMFDVNGKPVRLSDLKGKAVYIDFWATWCIPCCFQIPFMEKVAAHYKGDSRITCISVSMDSETDSWKSRLTLDKPDWPQYIAADSGKQIYKDYVFRGIPRFMLFDKEGKIVDTDAPRPQDMEAVCALIDGILE